MFSPRKKSKLLTDNFFILSGCVPAVAFGQCTHVLVKRNSNHVNAEKGLYIYNPAGFISLDENPHVKVTIDKGKMATAQKLGYIEILTHTDTWKEIEKEIKDKQKEEE